MAKLELLVNLVWAY